MAISNNNRSRYHKTPDDPFQQTFNTVEEKKFHDEFLSVLKKDPEHRIELNRPVYFHSDEHNCSFEASAVLYDETVGELVLVAAYRGGEDELFECSSIVKKNADNLLPLSDVIKEVKAQYEERNPGFTFEKSVRSAAVKKYVYEPFVTLFKRCYHSGDFACKNSPYIVSTFQNKYGDLRVKLEQNGTQIAGLDMPFDDMLSVGKECVDKYRYFEKGAQMYRNAAFGGPSVSDDEFTHKTCELEGAIALLNAGYTIDDICRIMIPYSEHNMFDPRNDESEVMDVINKYKSSKMIDHAVVFKLTGYTDTKDLLRNGTSAPKKVKRTHFITNRKF